MAYVEVDQSGKIEQFDKDTVVAISNGSCFAVLLPKRVKQEIFTKYKLQVRDLKYKLFAILIFLCARHYLAPDVRIVICAEYMRKDSIIKSFLGSLLLSEDVYY